MQKKINRAIPVRKGEWEEEGQRVVLLKKKSKYKLLRKLWGEYFRIHLDDIGSQAWMLCDGSHTVEQIAKKLEEKFGIDDSLKRTETFLLSLYKGDFLEFRIKE